MELTIYLSQVFGVYLLIMGVVIMLRRRYFIPVIGGFVEDRLTRTIVAMGELAAGLFLIFAHNDWSSLPAGIITFFAWMLLVESVFYLVSSDDLVDRMISGVNNRAWYIFGGIFSIIVGLYLAGFGFAWF